VEKMISSVATLMMRGWQRPSARKTGTRLNFLFSGEDQYVPYEDDKEKLVERWHVHVKQDGGFIDEESDIVEDASHTLKEGGRGLETLVERVVRLSARYRA